MASISTAVSEYPPEQSEGVRIYVDLHSNLNTPTDIENSIATLESTLRAAASVSTPQKGYVQEKIYNLTNRKIEMLVLEKRRLRRIWQTHRSPASKQLLKAATHALTRALKNEEQYAQYRYIQKLSPTSTKHSLWKAHHKLNAPIETEMPVRDHNGKWARSDAEKANTFASHLKNVFRPNPATNNFQLPPVPNVSKFEPLKFVPEEISKVIKDQLQPNKAPGHDLITPKMIIELPNCTMHHTMDQLDMLDPTGPMTTLGPMSETSLTPTHQHLHGSYHSMNHMMSHHHPGALSGHSSNHGHSAVHHPVISAAVAAAGLHPDTDTDPRELEAFAERFKQRRIKLGVTQADVGKALANLKLPGVGALSQSTICRFESLTLSHNNMIALKPILQAWLEEAEAQAKNKRRDPDAPSVLPAGEKKRTSIAAPEKRSLEAYFAVQPRPSGEKIAAIAEKLDLKKNVVRVWFCNQRQKQKRIVSSVTPSMTGHGSAGFGY
ncbi:PREDICTED: inhibitory POU protein-like [Rhagoletis zephyria]|nr:PREDICTED: inhibitory POU protein-like [Rhagoletis zephyria]